MRADMWGESLASLNTLDCHSISTWQGSLIDSSRRLTWRFDALVVKGIDTDFILLQVERILAALHSPKFVVTLEIGPSP